MLSFKVFLEIAKKTSWEVLTCAKLGVHFTKCFEGQVPEYMRFTIERTAAALRGTSAALRVQTSFRNMDFSWEGLTFVSKSDDLVCISEKGTNLIRCF